VARENAASKGRRLLAEGRLTVDLVDGRKVVASCRGDSAELWRLGYDPRTRTWRCSCPALTVCSHLHALRLVTMTPKEPGADS
jgi:hypothetical protein